MSVSMSYREPSYSQGSYVAPRDGYANAARDAKHPSMRTETRVDQRYVYSTAAASEQQHTYAHSSSLAFPGAAKPYTSGSAFGGGKDGHGGGPPSDGPQDILLHPHHPTAYLAGVVAAAPAGDTTGRYNREIQQGDTMGRYHGEIPRRGDSTTAGGGSGGGGWGREGALEHFRPVYHNNSIKPSIIPSSAADAAAAAAPSGAVRSFPGAKRIPYTGPLHGARERQADREAEVKEGEGEGVREGQKQRPRGGEGCMDPLHWPASRRGG